MYGEETAERQYSKYSELFYTTRIRVRQRYGDTEVGVVEEKKSLGEDNNPMYLEGVRTIGKSDSAVPQTLGQPS